MTLELYKEGAVWLFDDPSRNILREPFVEGASEALDDAFASDSLRAIVEFRDSRPDNSDLFFHGKWIAMEMRDNKQWNRYCVTETGREMMLCPVLYDYFADEPSNIWFRMMESA